MVKYCKLGCEIVYRNFMLRNLVICLLRSGRIEIIVIRVKEICRMVEKMIIFVKRGDFYVRR